MADIFLSYSRADRPVAQTMAESLEAAGFSVWWDKILRAGQTYDEVTETMLRDAQVVIVLWSATSVQSKWVRAEATLGQRKCELVPVMIEDAERPIMFELIQTADLIGWSGDRSELRWKEFVADVQRSLEKARASSGEEAPAPIPEPAPVPEPAPEPIASAPPSPAIKTPTEPTPKQKQVPKPAEKKKSSGLIPILLGGAAVVGAGAWFGLQAMSGDDKVTGGQTTTTAKSPQCDLCPEMVQIAAGTFAIGSPAGEAGRSGNEGPQIDISLEPFWISKSEVTWAEWQSCVDAGACSAAQGSGEGALPVSGVSWNDAAKYVEWLSSKSEFTFRLPSEAEWEYAARGGTSSPYWWGTNYPGPGVVTSKPSSGSDLAKNSFGVVGMLGNVREWVADCYVNSHANAPTDGGAVTSGDCGRRVVKGGSFKLGATEHRAANRARYGQTIRDSSLGFRVVAVSDAS